jgi:undecaprenyl diphosphate synthase
MEETSGNREMVLTLALGYGGRDEIVHAVRSIVRDSGSTRINPESITKEFFSQRLYTAGCPIRIC